MPLYGVVAVVVIGWWGVSSAVHGVKKLNHKIAHVVTKPFKHKKPAASAKPWQRRQS